MYIICTEKYINIYIQTTYPFPVNNLFPYPLNSTENMWFSDAFKGHERGGMWYGMAKYFKSSSHVTFERFLMT